MIQLLINPAAVLGPPDYYIGLLPHAAGRELQAERRARKDAGEKVGPVAGHRAIMLKRSNQVVVNRRTGRGSITKTASYKAWEKYALARLRPQVARRTRFAVDRLVWVCCIYTPPNKTGLPDLDGAVSTMLDLLQHSGAIENDRQVKRLDGSEIRAPDAHRPSLVAWVREVELYRHGASLSWGARLAP